MEVLADLLEEVKFRERFRGYDPDEVDAYVVTVTAAVAQVQSRLTELQHRVDAAEAQSPTRVLVLAQRTADAALAEAHEETVTITGAARLRAEQLMAEAAVERRRILEEAERDAVEAAEIALGRIRVKTSELEATRTGLQREVVALENRAAELRSMLMSSLAAFQSAIDALEAVSDNQRVPSPEISTAEVAESDLSQVEPVWGGEAADLVPVSEFESARVPAGGVVEEIEAAGAVPIMHRPPPPVAREVAEDAEEEQSHGDHLVTLADMQISSTSSNVSDHRTAEAVLDPDMAGPATQPIALGTDGSPPLFDDEAVADDPLIEQLRRTVANKQPPPEYD